MEQLGYNLLYRCFVGLAPDDPVWARRHSRRTAPGWRTRNGLAIDGRATHATGTAERSASEAMLKAKAKKSGCGMTVGEDKAYDTTEHVAKLREMNVTPHVAQYNSGNPNGRQSAIDGRTTRHADYGMSQTCRAMIECIFGWGKQHGTMRKTKQRGRDRVLGDFLLNLIGYNLVRIPKLIAA